MLSKARTSTHFEELKAKVGKLQAAAFYLENHTREFLMWDAYAPYRRLYKSSMQLYQELQEVQKSYVNVKDAEALAKVVVRNNTDDIHMAMANVCVSMDRMMSYFTWTQTDKYEYFWDRFAFLRYALERDLIEDDDVKRTVTYTRAKMINAWTQPWRKFNPHELIDMRERELFAYWDSCLEETRDKPDARRPTAVTSKIYAINRVLDFAEDATTEGRYGSLEDVLLEMTWNVTESVIDTAREVMQEVLQILPAIEHRARAYISSWLCAN